MDICTVVITFSCLLNKGWYNFPEKLSLEIEQPAVSFKESDVRIEGSEIYFTGKRPCSMDVIDFCLDTTKTKHMTAKLFRQCFLLHEFAKKAREEVKKDIFYNQAKCGLKSYAVKKTNDKFVKKPDSKAHGNNRKSNHR